VFLSAPGAVRDPDEPKAGCGAHRILGRGPAASSASSKHIKAKRTAAFVLHLAGDDREHRLLGYGEARGNGRRHSAAGGNPTTTLDSLRPAGRALRASWWPEDAGTAHQACWQPLGRSCLTCGVVEHSAGVDPLGQPLCLVVTDYTHRQPAPDEPAQIVQNSATTRGVNGGLYLCCKHGFALGFVDPLREAFTFGMAPPLREMTISPLDGGLMLREDHSRKTVDLLGFMPDVNPPSWRVLCFHGESEIRLPVASIPSAIQDVNVRPRIRAISVSILGPYAGPL
jgi:hypothetical protein